MMKQLFRWCSLVLTLTTALHAETTDLRSAPLKDFDGYFPFTVPPSAEAWQKRKAELRQQLQVSLGLFPLPARTPLQAVIHSRKDMGDYFLEKAYFQSLPGVYVTGSLYRPKNATGKSPGVLCPHGHWNNGRFLEEPESSVKAAIASGAEELVCAARSPLQARCVHLARMGCVVFHYDMLGYADSMQVSYETAHKFGTSTQPKATPGGFFTAEAEGNLISVMGLQTWNGIRALDFLEELPDVDSKRLGVTGASGGGTQTFLLCAVDDRPAAAFPAVMVSTAMQGGCTCENASLLRIGTGNVEMAALFAPKPLGMTCAKDWTVDMPTKGFPELQQLYKLLGKPDLVSLTDTRPHGHNYNHLSRVGMEQWFAKHLLNGATAPPEREFTFQSAKDLTVWDAEHPAPATGPAAEREVVRQMKLAAANSAGPGNSFLAWFTLFGRTISTTGNCVCKLTGDKTETDSYFKISGEVRNETHSEIVPVTFLHPKAWRNRVAIWASEKGSAALFGADGQPVAEVQALLDKGWAVAGPDLIQTGATRNRKVENPREAAAYTYGYNSPLLVQRVHDLLSVINMVQTNPDYKTEKIALAAAPGAPGNTALTAAAAAMSGDVLTACSYDEASFSFSKLTDIYDPNFLPGAVKYGDLGGLSRLVNHKCPLAELAGK